MKIDPNIDFKNYVVHYFRLKKYPHKTVFIVYRKKSFWRKLKRLLC